MNAIEEVLDMRINWQEQDEKAYDSDGIFVNTMFTEEMIVASVNCGL